MTAFIDIHAHATGPNARWRMGTSREEGVVPKLLRRYPNLYSDPVA